MQLEGFTFDGIYLKTPSEKFDLHNCFDFTGFAYDVSSRIISLRWIPNEHAKAAESRRILLEIHGVSHFSCESRKPGIPFTEDTCVCNILREPASEDYVFEFMSGFTLRVNGDRARWKVEDAG